MLLAHFEMPLTLERRQIDARDTGDSNIIERQVPTTLISAEPLSLSIARKSERLRSIGTPSSVPPRVSVNLMRTWPLAMVSFKAARVFSRRLASTGWSPLQRNCTSSLTPPLLVDRSLLQVLFGTACAGWCQADQAQARDDSWVKGNRFQERTKIERRSMGKADRRATEAAAHRYLQ